MARLPACPEITKLPGGGPNGSLAIATKVSLTYGAGPFLATPEWRFSFSGSLPFWAEYTPRARTLPIRHLRGRFCRDGNREAAGRFARHSPVEGKRASANKYLEVQRGFVA